MFFCLDTSRKCTPYNQKVYTTRECTLNIGNYQPPRVVRFFSLYFLFNLKDYISYMMCNGEFVYEG